MTVAIEPWRTYRRRYPDVWNVRPEPSYSLANYLILVPCESCRRPTEVWRNGVNRAFCDPCVDAGAQAKMGLCALAHRNGCPEAPALGGLCLGCHAWLPPHAQRALAKKGLRALLDFLDAHRMTAVRTSKYRR
jgi:hypothetical protein